MGLNIDGCSITGFLTPHPNQTHIIALLAIPRGEIVAALMNRVCRLTITDELDYDEGGDGQEQQEIAF